MIVRPWRQITFSAPVRAVLLCLAFSLLISVPILLFVYHQTDALFEERLRTAVDDRQERLVAGYDRGGIAGLVAAIDEDLATGETHGEAILLVDRNGRRAAGNIAAWPPTLRPPADWVEMRLYPERSTQPTLYALRVLRLRGGEMLLLGANVEDREHMRASLVEALIGALVLAIPLGLIAGVLLLRVSERQARHVRDVAGRIAAGDFSHRVDEGAEGEEFALLASAINIMLERIEELVEQLRLVTDSLAHDLRSPLTRMRANIERAAGYADAEPEQQALEAISVDIDRILRLISATLEISRAEAGVGRHQFAEFDIAELLEDIGEIYLPVAEEQGVALSAGEAPSLLYRGNRQLIGRSLANLVDNALKYGASGGEIVLGAAQTAKGIDLTVADRGPGIPPELRDDAVGKYRRLEEARTTEGSGLGLAMVRAVARHHGGDIRLEDNEPGLRVVMTLHRELPDSADVSGGA